MQRVREMKILAAGLLLVAASCAKHDNGLMGYPKYRSRTAPGGTSREMPDQPPPRILPETYYAAGRMFEQQGAIDQAVEQYRKAVALNHNYAAAYQRLGLVLSITDRHDEALAALSRAVELKSDNAVLRNNLGFELLYQQRWAEAERHLREAVRIDPKLARAHINLGLLLARIERHDEALDSFRRAIPEPDAYYNLGLVLRAQKRYEQAAEAFNHVLSLNPEFTAARRQLAQIQDKIEKVEQQDRAETTLPAERPTVAASEPDPSPTTVVEAPVPTTVADGSPAAPVAEQLILAAVANEQNMASVVEPSAHPAIAEEFQNPSFVEPLETPADELDLVAGPVTSESPSVGGVVTAAATATETVTQQTPTQTYTSDWGLTLSEIAQALDIFDNDRRCRDEEEERAQAERDVKLQTETTAFDAQVTWTRSIEVPRATAEKVPQEVVLVLPATETRETADARPEPVSAPSPTAGGSYERTWTLMRDLEKSLEIIRNELECRRGDVQSTGREPVGPETIVRPAAFDGQTDETRIVVDPCGEPDPAERTTLWDASFGELEAILSIARNEDYCVAFESVAACRSRAVSAIAAALPFVPASLIPFDALQIGSDRVIRCEPMNDSAARSVDRFGSLVQP